MPANYVWASSDYSQGWLLYRKRSPDSIQMSRVINKETEYMYGLVFIGEIFPACLRASLSIVVVLLSRYLVSSCNNRSLQNISFSLTEQIKYQNIKSVASSSYCDLVPALYCCSSLAYFYLILLYKFASFNAFSSIFCFPLK